MLELRVPDTSLPQAERVLEALRTLEETELGAVLDSLAGDTDVVLVNIAEALEDAGRLSEDSLTAMVAGALECVWFDPDSDLVHELGNTQPWKAIREAVIAVDAAFEPYRDLHYLGLITARDAAEHWAEQACDSSMRADFAAEVETLTKEIECYVAPQAA